MSHLSLLEIWEDVQEECSKFGALVDMKIPRPQEGNVVPGLGMVSTRFLLAGTWKSMFVSMYSLKFRCRYLFVMTTQTTL